MDYYCCIQSLWNFLLSYHLKKREICNLILAIIQLCLNCVRNTLKIHCEYLANALKVFYQVNAFDLTGFSRLVA